VGLNRGGVSVDELNADAVCYDNTTSGLTATDAQAAIDEIANTVATSASPGFSFGRASAVNAGTWLQCETVPSNKAGRFVYIASAEVQTIFISNELISTFDIEIYHHEGDEVNLTLLTTISVVASRGGSFTVGLSVPTNKQLALKLSSGSARNLVCGLELSGTN
jgi:hypothetical protein